MFAVTNSEQKGDNVIELEGQKKLKQSLFAAMINTFEVHIDQDLYCLIVQTKNKRFKLEQG